MANPVLSYMDKSSENETVIDQSKIMTVNGTIQATAILGIVLMLAAGFTWSRFTLGYNDLGNMLTTVGAIGGLILAFVIIFAKTYIMTPVYAACEGCFIGGISFFFEQTYPGIVSQAVACSFAALFSMLLLYRSGFIKCTDKFRSVLLISTLSIGVVYLVDFIGRFLGYAVPIINTSSNLGILFSVVVVIIAALNLIADFDFIERGANMMLPKNFEWYGAFGLMVTMVWLYVEVLKLLSKFRSRN